MLTPALYRTRITHLRRAPVHHYFEHHSYSWYVDVDQLPQLPRWLRPFARFDARDHFDRASRMTHCGNGSTHSWRTADIDLRGGTVTALLQARVLGYVFNPTEPVLVPRRRRCAAPRSGRSAQHLRRPPRLSAAA